MKLFAIYIGGEHPSANIEIHDVRFVVAPSIRETYDTLRADWWGTPGTLHVDCWAEINHVGSYDIDLRSERPSSRERLYFINLGGYDGLSFAEQHKNMFVVATNVTDAKAQALQSIEGWTDAHRDDLFEAEKAFALDELIGDRLHIHVTPSPDTRSPRFTCKYTPLK